MKQDGRSQSLKDLGIRTLRGAAIFAVKYFVVCLVAVVLTKIVGEWLTVPRVVELSWLDLLLAPIASSLGMFGAVAFYTEAQKALLQDDRE